MTSFQSSKLILWSTRVAGDPGVVDHDVDRAKLGRDPLAAGEAGFVVADVPLVGGNAGLAGEARRTRVVAAIVGGDVEPHVLEREADRLADSPGAPGHDRHARHCISPAVCMGYEFSAARSCGKPRDRCRMRR